MNERKRRQPGSNEGIQARDVTAEIIAVGRGARAYKSAPGDGRELTGALNALRHELDSLSLAPQAKAAIHEDLAKLTEASRPDKQAPDRAGDALQSLTGKLKMIGIVLGDVVALSEPARKLAELLHIPLKLLGL